MGGGGEEGEEGEEGEGFEFPSHDYAVIYCYSYIFITQIYMYLAKSFRRTHGFVLDLESYIFFVKQMDFFQSKNKYMLLLLIQGVYA